MFPEEFHVNFSCQFFPYRVPLLLEAHLSQVASHHCTTWLHTRCCRRASVASCTSGCIFQVPPCNFPPHQAFFFIVFFPFLPVLRYRPCMSRKIPKGYLPILSVLFYSSDFFSSYVLRTWPWERNCLGFGDLLSVLVCPSVFL